MRYLVVIVVMFGSLSLTFMFSDMAFSQQPTDSQDSLTIYSSARPGGVPTGLYLPRESGYSGSVPGFAVVRHQREYDITSGQSQLRVLDVAAGIDPTTVAFRSITRPETRVLEQSFEFDLVNQSKLLNRYIGQNIAVDQLVGDRLITVQGELLSTTGGLILRLQDGSVQTLNNFQNVRFQELPEGLITRPTVVWNLDASRSGKQQVQISYQTSGMTWWTDYNLIIDPDQQCTMDLSAWVTLVNQSGASYQQAKLKLLAGEVNRYRGASPTRARVQQSIRLEQSQLLEDSFQEKSFNEYHLYTLGRSIDIPQNTTKQTALFPTVIGAECEQVLVMETEAYGGRGGFDKNFTGATELDAFVYVEFENTEENKLGVPLPAGRVRVSQIDGDDGNLEFVGEDGIGHTPNKETIRLHTGTAFDVKGSRKQTNFRYDPSRKQLWESWEIEIRNRKQQPVNVLLNESLFRASNWSVTDSSDTYSKRNSNSIQYELDIPADTVKTITYSVHYSW